MKSRKILALVIAAIAVIVSLLISITLFQSPGCIPVKRLDASIKVKVLTNLGMIGLNADTDSLKFGVVSPGISAQRYVLFQHSKPAKVVVTMNGDLEAWTGITPAEFTITPEETKEVHFDVNVPVTAAPGNYTGTAVFCLRE